MTVSSDSPELKPNLSRREFMKSFGVGAGIAAATGIPLLDYYVKMVTESKMDLGELAFLAIHHKDLDEIARHRESISLSGLPRYLSMSRLIEAANSSWESAAPSIQNNIPNAHKSSADQAIRHINLMLGSNAGRFVSSVSTDLDVVTAGTFDRNSREMAIDTANDPNSDKFGFISAHETTHSWDPGLINPDTPIYPLDKLVKVSHGISRILSRSTKIEGMFFNNPTAYNIPFIKKCIGEGVGRAFIQDPRLTDQVDNNGHLIILRKLHVLAEEQGESIYSMKFTKKACVEIGDTVLKATFNKEMEMQGELLNRWYIPNAESAMPEILADMVATTLIHPEKINYDKEIIDGLQEVLSTIQQKNVDTLEVAEQLQTDDKKIGERFAEETELLESIQNNESISSENDIQVNPAMMQEIVETLEEETRSNDIFWDFILLGQIPEGMEFESEDEKKIFQEYGDAISKVYKTYPGIIYGLTRDDMSFDPNFHIWETYDFAEAWNSDVFYNLLSDPSLVSTNVDDLRRRTEVLKRFIDTDPKFLEG